MEAGGLAETDERGRGEEREGRKQPDANHPAACHEGQGENAAAVVCQRAGSEDGGHPWPGGVPDGVAVHGRGAVGRRIPTQEADWADIRPCRCAGDEGGILALSTEVWPHSDDALPRSDLPDWGRALVRGRSVLQLAEPAGRDSRRSVVLRNERQGAGGEVEGELPEPDGVSAADRAGMRVFMPGG